MNLDKRMGKIEIEAAPTIIKNVMEEQRKKKAEALEEWRANNCNRISWDLFVLIEGPKLEHPDDHKKDGENDTFVDSRLAYFAMIDRVMSFGIDEEGFLIHDKMSTEERAFSVCFENLFWRYDDADGWLLDRGISTQAIALGIGLALHDGEISVAEAVQRIDEHRGGPEWRQIRGSNADQEELDSKFEIPTITEIPKKGRPWKDPGVRS